MTTLLILLAIIVLLPIAAMIVLKVFMWMLSAFICTIAIGITVMATVINFLFKSHSKRRRSNYISH